MSTSKELKAQAEELIRQAEDLRKQEAAQHIATIKHLIAEYGITAADIGLGQSTKPKAARKASGQAKYRDPASGATWTGKGRLPAWAQAHKAAGRDLAELAIQ